MQLQLICQTCVTALRFARRQHQFHVARVSYRQGLIKSKTQVVLPFPYPPSHFPFSAVSGAAPQPKWNLVHFSFKLEIRSVERGICPIATSTMNELFL